MYTYLCAESLILFGDNSLDLCHFLLLQFLVFAVNGLVERLKPLTLPVLDVTIKE